MKNIEKEIETISVGILDIDFSLLCAYMDENHYILFFKVPFSHYGRPFFSSHQIFL